MADDEPRPDTDPESSATVTEPSPDATEEPADQAEDKPAKLNQAVEMRDIGPCKKHIKVTVDRADIDHRLNDKYSELVVEANVPGFRPGKAPRRIIERRFAKDVSSQVLGELMLASLEQLAEEHDIAPLSAPNLDPSKLAIPKEGPLVYEFEVEVRPHFDLPNYRGLKLRRPVKTFSDEEVAEEERRILAPYGKLVPKTDGGAEAGDYLVADITTRAGGRLLSDLKDIKLRIEPRLAFKDAVAEHFGEQTKGAKVGDVRQVDITLSESSADAALRGQTAQATMTVKEVNTLQLPALTHDFLHEFGVHSPEQLKEWVRVLLQRRLEYTQRQSARAQVIQQIAAASAWELPQDLLARQARKALGRKVMEMRNSGIAEEEIRGRQRLLEQDVLQSTALALKEHFVLQKIAEVEKLDVDDDDIDDAIERIARQSNESPRRVRARLEKEDMLDALAAEIVERKALDLVLDSAEYEDVPVGATEEEGAVTTVEEQTVPGEMKDPMAVPPAAEGDTADSTEKADERPKEKEA
jgi:trigger factor